MGQPVLWFPEVKEALRAQWHPSLSWDDLVALRGKLANVVAEARKRAGARDSWCAECCAYNAKPVLTVGAVISKTAYLGLQSHQEARRLNGRWAYRRKKRRLDLVGRPRSAASDTNAGHHRHEGGMMGASPGGAPTPPRP